VGLWYGRNTVSFDWGTVILRSDVVANLYVKWNSFRIMVVGSKCYQLVAHRTQRMKLTLHPC